MTDRLLFAPIALLLGFAAWRLGLGYLGLGVLIGIAIPLFHAWRGDPFTPSIEIGGFFGLLGVFCFLAALYIAGQHGLTLSELDGHRNLSKGIRRLPYYAVVLFTVGAFIVATGIAKKMKDPE